MVRRASNGGRSSHRAVSLQSSFVSPQRPVRVYLPCTGLGRQQRGFETFTLECADALRAGRRIAEQATFFLSFLPALVTGRPDVVYFAALDHARLLLRVAELPA